MCGVILSYLQGQRLPRFGGKPRCVHGHAFSRARAEVGGACAVAAAHETEDELVSRGCTHGATDDAVYRRLDSQLSLLIGRLGDSPSLVVLCSLRAIILRSVHNFEKNLKCECGGGTLTSINKPGLYYSLSLSLICQPTSEDTKHPLKDYSLAQWRKKGAGFRALFSV